MAYSVSFLEEIVDLLADWRDPAKECSCAGERREKQCLECCEVESYTD